MMPFESAQSDGHHYDSQTQVSTVKRLPFEILSSIFCFARDFASIDDTREVDRLRQYLVSITAICRSWRQAAMLDNLLWATVRVPYYSRNTMDHIISYLETIIERSGNTSLDLTFELPYSADPESTKQIIAIVYPHLHRCHTIDLDINRNSVANQLLLPLPGRLERLKCLRITHPYVGFRDVVGKDSTPLLDSLYFCGDCVYSHLENLQTDALRSIKLDLTGGALRGIEFLANCQFVKHLDLLELDNPLSWNPPSFTLPQLKTLTIRNPSSFAILHFIETPVLAELTIHRLHSAHFPQPTMDSHWPLRSNQFLRKLNLSSSDLDHHSIPILMEFYGTLMEMVLNDCRGHLVFASLLAPHSHSDIPFSSVQTNIPPEEQEWRTTTAISPTHILLVAIPDFCCPKPRFRRICDHAAGSAIQVADGGLHKLF